MTDILKKFGRYFLLDKIAQGGMAEIYRARLASLDGAGRFLVIKRMAANYGNNTEFLNMFKDEIRVTMGFNHPNIVQLFDFGEESEQPYIAMEFVDGKNLRQFIGRNAELRRTFPVDLAVYVIEQAAAGLHYAHQFKDRVSGESLNIVHRDISPQNILLSYDGAIKVIDFGIAKTTVQGEATRVGVIKGKPSYLAPEQITGQAVDGRCDIFALGIVLWELLAGRKLFAGENDLATIKLIESCQNHVVAPSTYNPKVSKELDYIALRALAKQREKRYQSADEFQRVLHKYLYASAADFNPADLSHFSKDLFKEEIVRDRKKLQELTHKAEGILALESKAAAAGGAGVVLDEKTVVGPRGVASTGARNVFSKQETDTAGNIRVDAPMTQGLLTSNNRGRSPDRSHDRSRTHTAERLVPRQHQLARPQAEGAGWRKLFVGMAAAVAAAIFVLPEFGIRVPILSALVTPAPKLSGTIVLEGDNKVVSVSVDGQEMGRGLPITLKKLPVGKPLNVLVKGPAGSYEQIVSLEAGESRVIPVKIGSTFARGKMDRVPAAGKTVSLLLNVYPGGGEPVVMINGVNIDPESLTSVQPLDTALELQIERPGFRLFRREFVLQSHQIGDQKEWSMDVQLEPESFGYLTLSTTPKVVTAIIMLDGKPWVRKTPIEKEKLPVGIYNIRLVHEVLGMEKTITVNIQDQRILPLDVQLEVKD